MKSMIAIAGLVAIAGTASAQEIVNWMGGNATNSPAMNVAAGITGNDMVRGAGVSDPGFSTFNTTDYTPGADLATAVANEEYISFGITVDAGNTVDLTNLDIRLDRSGTGPDDFAILLWGGDLGSSTNLFSFDFGDSSSGIEFNIPLSLTGLSGTVEFRVYPFAAESSGGTFDIESFDFPEDPRGVSLSGLVVPAPGAVALMGLAGVAGLRRRRA